MLGQRSSTVNSAQKCTVGAESGFRGWRESTSHSSQFGLSQLWSAPRRKGWRAHARRRTPRLDVAVDLRAVRGLEHPLSTHHVSHERIDHQVDPKPRPAVGPSAWTCKAVAPRSSGRRSRPNHLLLLAVSWSLVMDRWPPQSARETARSNIRARPAGVHVETARAASPNGGWATQTAARLRAGQRFGR